MNKAVFIIFAFISLSVLGSDTSRNLQSLVGVSYTNQGTDWTGTCASGSLQSPIDIDSNTATCDESMQFDITFSTSINLTVANVGTTLQVTPTTASELSELYVTDINGLLTGYSGQSFIFRAPSEHEIDGDSYDLELQIVHNISSTFASKGLTIFTSAIVSVFFESSSSASDNAFITALSLSTPGSLTNVTLSSLMSTIFPSTGSEYYTYQGSFTTPTCSETVNYYIMTTPQSISTTQLAVFTALYSGSSTFAGGNGNNRALQSVNDRTIKKGGTECEEQFVYFFSFLILYIFINYFIFKLL